MDKQRRNLLAGGAVLLAAGVGVSVKALAQDRVIPVVARKFVFLPSDIHLKKGETVILEFTAPASTWRLPASIRPALRTR